MKLFHTDLNIISSILKILRKSYLLAPDLVNSFDSDKTNILMNIFDSL